MADEVKRIIEIDAKYETLAQLQQIVEKNKAAIEGLDKSSAQYQKGLAELKGAQKEYQQEMRIAVKETTSAKNSYNDLVNQLARAKEVWKQAAPDSQAFIDATHEVNRLKGDLEAMDHSIGNYQRNVGNYANSISSVAGLFGRAGQAATGAVRGVQGLTMGFKALSATPVIAVLTVLVSLITKVGQSLKQSEAASMRMAEALAPLKAGGDLVRIAFEGLANGLASVAEWLGKVADKLGLYTDRMKENQAIVKESNALKEREREIMIENAKLDAEAAEAQRKARKKANLSEKERLALLETAEAALNKKLQNNLELAEKQFDLAKRRAALAPNDAAANDALAQAEARLWQVRAENSRALTRITSQESAAQLEMQRDIDNTNKSLEKQSELFDKLLEKYTGYNAKHQEAIENQKAEAQSQKEWEKMVKEEDDAISEEIDRIIADQKREAEAHKEFVKQTISNYQAVAAGISSVLDSVAGAWQNEIKAQVEAGKISEEEGERQFENVKALQYATTWINTLSAAIAALASPEPMPWAVKIANAASATAAGIANTIKIANTTLGNTQTSSAVGQGVQSVQTVAPAVQVAVPEYRTLTSASDEQSINDRYANQKVVLVTSELEAHNEGRKVKLAESTF